MNIAENKNGGLLLDIINQDGKLLATGSLDNCTRVWSAETGKLLYSMKDHVHFVQGVSFDPCGKYLATQSSDRSLNIYRYFKDSAKILSKNQKLDNGKRLYHDENMMSFFRRLEWSPDGSILATPGGLYHKETAINVVHVYSRADLKKPSLIFPGFKRPTVACRFSPIYYQSNGNVFDFEYSMILAVASQDSVLVYDVQKQTPVFIFGNIHFATITDLSWSSDGLKLMISSNDGFCSIVSFEHSDFGVVLDTQGHIPSSELHSMPLDSSIVPLDSSIVNEFEGVSEIDSVLGMEVTEELIDGAECAVQEGMEYQCSENQGVQCVQNTPKRSTEGVELELKNLELAIPSKKRRIAPVFLGMNK